MTICPIAIAAGCDNCPLFKVCPAKGIIGDFTGEDADKSEDDNKTEHSD